MKNRLINKNKIYLKKKEKKKRSFTGFFGQQFCQQNPVKITVKHYFYIV